jgi:citrate synthase
MKSWVTRDEALNRLGVKPQTLYAYVSRGRIRTEADPADMRRSLFNAEDLAQLTIRRARGRKPEVIAASSMAWGEPAIATSLSMVHRGKLYYRGEDAIALARGASVEQVAALLWDVAPTLTFPSLAPVGDDAFTALAAMASLAQPMIGRGRDSHVDHAREIVGAIAALCGAAPGDAPLHLRLARGWDCDEAVAERLRQALIAMADHDMNASTFACRVAASTGASLAASILAGLCALSGPRHGGAAAALAQLLSEARRSGCRMAIEQWLDRGIELPGFGHPLYPEGDPRGAVLLEGLALDAFLLEFAQDIRSRTGLFPNCDFALAAMVEALRLPLGAPFRLFLLGRSLGWCAHAIEQSQAGSLIRPRGRYEGITPVD